MPLRSSTVATLRSQLAEIASGRRELDPATVARLADACDQMLQAIHNAPRPGEPREAVGVWHNGDADPALDSLVRLLAPQLAENREQREMSDREAAAALRDALEKR